MSKRKLIIISVCLILLSVCLSAFIVFFHPKPEHRGLDASPIFHQLNRIGPPPQIPLEIDSLKITYTTINLINSYYMDPTRIDWKEMLIEAVRALQEQVSSVLVKKEKESLVVAAGSQAM